MTAFFNVNATEIRPGETMAAMLDRLAELQDEETALRLQVTGTPEAQEIMDAYERLQEAVQAKVADVQVQMAGLRQAIEENVMAILETLPIGARERRRRLEYLLEELKIGYLAKQKAYTLSGGERRRLEITRALVTDPALILLDEPFSGVDPLAVYDVQQIIRDLKQRGLGILVTDHNVRETLSVVDRAYVIYSGEVLTEGTREFLVNDPQAREKYLGREFSM